MEETNHSIYSTLISYTIENVIILFLLFGVQFLFVKIYKLHPRIHTLLCFHALCCPTPFLRALRTRLRPKIYNALN